MFKEILVLFINKETFLTNLLNRLGQSCSKLRVEVEFILIKFKSSDKVDNSLNLYAPREAELPALTRILKLARAFGIAVGRLVLTLVTTIFVIIIFVLICKNT